MKTYRITLLITLFAWSFTAFTQQLSNNSFENWYVQAGYEKPNDWNCTTRFVWYDFQMYGVVKDSGSYEGSLCALLETVQDIEFTDTVTLPGMLSLAQLDVNIMNYKVYVGDPVPFAFKPSALRGYYKYFPMEQDTAIVKIDLTSYNSVTGSRDTIGRGLFVETDTVDQWSLFEVSIDYIGQQIPDSMNLILSSSPLYNVTKGSRFFIDSLTFVYTGSPVETVEKENFMIFPNPCGERLYVRAFDGDALSVFDYSGKEVYITSTRCSQNQLELNVSSLPAGAYYVVFRDDLKRESLSFIKQ